MTENTWYRPGTTFTITREKQEKPEPRTITVEIEEREKPEPIKMEIKTKKSQEKETPEINIRGWQETRNNPYEGTNVC